MGYSNTTTCRNILWRLRDLQKDPFFRNDVKKAIMLEAGMDDRTIEKYWKVLRKLDYIKCLHGAVCTFGENAP